MVIFGWIAISVLIGAIIIGAFLILMKTFIHWKIGKEMKNEIEKHVSDYMRIKNEE